MKTGGDTLIVWRLDRLGQSVPHLVTLVQEMLEKGIEFRSVYDGTIDTTTAFGVSSGMKTPDDFLQAYPGTQVDWIDRSTYWRFLL